MKKILFGALVALLPLSVMADTILGFKIGTGIWNHDPSGSITSSVGGAGTSADLKDGLNLGKKSEGYTHFSIEHPVPFVPNLKYMQTSLSSSGSGNAGVTYTFNGTTVTSGSPADTSLNLDQTDTILYYEILDNFVSLDLGINLKYIDGKAVVNTDSSSFSETVPMLYGSVEVALPADITLGMEVSTISAGSSSISDITAKVSYETDYMLGVEAGIRTQSIDVDVDSVKTSIKFSGLFAGVYYKF